MRHKTLLLAAAAVMFTAPAFAQQSTPEQKILFTNVHVFDGVNEQRIENANVVVTGNRITAVSREPLAVANARVIDGGGRTLMPGLADTHVHLAFSSLPQMLMFAGDPGYNFIHQTKDAKG